MRQDGVSSEEHMPRYDALRRNALVRTFRVAAKQGCRASKAVCSHTERGNKAMAPKQCRLYLCRGPKGAEPDSPGHRPGLWSPLKMLQGPTGRNRSGNGPLGLATQKSNRFPRAAALGYRVWLLRSCSASGLSSLAPSEPFGFYALHGLVCPMSLGVENSDNFNRPQYITSLDRWRLEDAFSAARRRDDRPLRRS